MADPDHFILPTLKIQWQGPGVSFISDTSYYARKERVNGYSGTLYDLSYFQHFLSSDPSVSIYQVPYPTDPQELVLIVPAAFYPLLVPTGINTALGQPLLNNYFARNLITNSQYNWTQEFRLQSNNAECAAAVGGRRVPGLQLPAIDRRDQRPGTAGDHPTPMGRGHAHRVGRRPAPNGDDYIKDTRSHDRQIALFADATYNITEQLKAEIGLRFAWTHFDFVSVDDGPQDLLDNGGVPNVSVGGKNEKPFTPKFSLSYQITPDDMVYGTVSKGYRIGGATPPLPEIACGGDFPTQYNSDSVWSYEVGSKDRFFDRRLQISGSAYYISWSNIQQSILVPSCAIMFTTNVGSAVSKGFDLQGSWQLTSAFDVEFAVGYNKATFSNDAIETVGAPDGGNQSIFLAGKGDSFDITPWTVTLGAQYNFHMFDRPAFIRADWEYSSLSERRRPPIQDPNALSFDPGLVNNPDPPTWCPCARA